MCIDRIGHYFFITLVKSSPMKKNKPLEIPIN
jgi:hypothetical protein